MSYIVSALLLASAAFTAGLIRASGIVRREFNAVRETERRVILNFLLPYTIGVGSSAQVVIPVDRLLDFLGAKRDGTKANR